MAAETPITPQSEDDFVVTIEKVAGKINYSKLIERFGSQPIPQSLVDRVERLTKRPAHPFLKRGFFFSHRCVLPLPPSFSVARCRCRLVLGLVDPLSLWSSLLPPPSRFFLAFPSPLPHLSLLYCNSSVF